MVSEVLPAGALIGAEGYEPNPPTNHAMLATAGKTRDFEDYVDKCKKLDRVTATICYNNESFLDLMYELKGRMTQEDKDKLLAVACQHSREDIARVLLVVGANANVVPASLRNTEILRRACKGENKTALANAALVQACMGGREAEAKFLLTVGADVNCVDKGCTPLMTASFWGREAMVKFLLEKGADVNLAPPNGNTPLMSALSTTLGVKETVVKWLLEKGADVNLASGPCRRTPLLYACSRGNGAMVKLLLEKGADVNWEDRSGNSALSLCWNNRNMRSLLLKAGASKGVALLSAIRHIYPSSSRFAGAEHQVILDLVRSGANVNIVGKDGKTPLMLAREKRLKEVEQLLIAAGATR